MSFSALDCVLNREKAIYASAELTTGRRLYDAMREFNVKTAADLKQLKGKDWYTANIWDANVKAAQDFAAHVREKLGGKTLVITPAPFSAPGWTQPEYLAFWEQLLRTRISSSWFKADWQYSNGCTFEFAVSRTIRLAFARAPRSSTLPSGTSRRMVSTPPNSAKTSPAYNPSPPALPNP
jgi:hypothetical protein